MGFTLDREMSFHKLMVEREVWWVQFQLVTVC